MLIWMIWAWSWARREVRDAERSGNLVELLDQRRRQRHAVGLPIRPARLAALSRNADLIHAGEPRRGAEIAHVAGHLRAELVERQKTGDIEGDHELPRICLAGLFGIDVLDVAAERRPI